MKRRIVADERRFIYASENYALENMHWKNRRMKGIRNPLIALNVD